MIKTVKVATDRASDETKTVLPAEVARGVYVEHSPSAEALKLMHLLIGKAGGRMADDTHHSLRLADINSIEGMRNHGRASLKGLFIELRAVVLSLDNTDEKIEIIGGFIDHAKIDYSDEINGEVLITWWFGRAFREMAAASYHWAIMDRQTILAMTSRYSILLFQHIASLANLKHINSKTFTVAEMRALLGVMDGKLERFANLKARALQPAVEEINHVSRLSLEATYQKTGRTVTSVSIAWQFKADLTPVKAAQSNHSIARNGKRKEAQERLSFPATGSVQYTDPWEGIARTNCNWDHAKIADAFRSFCAQRNIKLDAKSIEEIFANFCKKQARI